LIHRTTIVMPRRTPTINPMAKPDRKAIMASLAVGLLLWGKRDRLGTGPAPLTSRRRGGLAAGCSFIYSARRQFSTLPSLPFIAAWAPPHVCAPSQRRSYRVRRPR
jgi:hypothetical protein